MFMFPLHVIDIPGHTCHGVDGLLHHLITLLLWVKVLRYLLNRKKDHHQLGVNLFDFMQMIQCCMHIDTHLAYCFFYKISCIMHHLMNSYEKIEIKKESPKIHVRSVSPSMKDTATATLWIYFFHSHGFRKLI